MEYPNFEHPDRKRDEPSVLDTKITIDSPEKLGQLEAKLEEYEERNRTFSDIRPDKQVDLYGVDRYVPVFKEAVLRAVLTLAQDPHRDLAGNPIVLPEVAMEVMSMTGLDVTRSVTTPFVYEEKTHSYQPDIAFLWESRSYADIGFSEAYAIIREYAGKGESEELSGGTGLPAVESVEDEK